MAEEQTSIDRLTRETRAIGEESRRIMARTQEIIAQLAAVSP